MDIGYKDLRPNQKDTIIHYMKMKGYSEADIPNEFDKISKNPENALEWLSYDEELLEEIMRRFVYDYLEFIVDKIIDE